MAIRRCPAKIPTHARWDQPPLPHGLARLGETPTKISSILAKTGNFIRGYRLSIGRHLPKTPPNVTSNGTDPYHINREGPEKTIETVSGTTPFEGGLRV
jgi:hypothetical protein